MNLRPKYSDVWLNLLVALAVSLVVNFSYLLLLIVDKRGDMPRRQAAEQIVERDEEGVLRVSADGHGYLVYENGDSAYVPQSYVRRLRLTDGDRIVTTLSAPRRAGAHPVLNTIRVRNGEEFDYGSVFSRPSEAVQFAVQLLFYLVLSFVLLTILTATRHGYSPWRFTRACLWCLAVAAVFYLFAPVRDWHSGRIVINLMSNRTFDYMLLLQCSFAVAVSMLYGRIYVLISQRQAVIVENEQLKTENLTTRYNMLVGQINPHFFFNSLNSLAMLVREKQDQKALTYIDQLSYAFRYVIQNGQSTLVTLGDELKFAEAHAYLFKIRFEDKLFFDIDVADEYRSWLLPALSLQPLIDNAVKHNTITRANPFRISIRTEGEWLVVSNPIVPKLETEPSTGIGLENLRNRSLLVTGRDIEVVNDGRTFTVRLPLQNPALK